MTRPCKNCRRTVHKPVPSPIPQQPSKAASQPTQIELAEPNSAEVRRTMVGKTIRIRLKRPE